MNVFLQLSSNLGEDLGPNFSITADIGSVQPNTATKSELVAGRFFEVNENATTLTVSDTGGCGSTIQIEIGGKTPETCFRDIAENWRPGNARRLDENGSDTFFRSTTISQGLFEEIISAEFGQVVTITVFGNTYTFSINEESADEESGILFRSGATTTGIEPEATLVVKIEDFGFGQANVTIFDDKRYSVYEIYEQNGSYIVEEWSIYDYF
jgi:hypothetical protein